LSSGVTIPKDYRLPKLNSNPNHVIHPLPHTYLRATDLPTNWDWRNVNGESFVARSMNQHIPQYCGCCWLFGGMHSLQDRVKIARSQGKSHPPGPDIGLSLQFILNCGGDVAGSCHGGDATGLYQFIHDTGYVPFETCLTWEACDKTSKEGHCSKGDYTCKPINTCRTCNTYTDKGGKCVEVTRFPNVTVKEYGEVVGEQKMMAEIYARGPIACSIDATILLDYNGGIIDDNKPTDDLDHVVSVIGWGVDSATGTKYWLARNSWGEYWGEMGFFKIKRGENQQGIESGCSWAAVDSWSVHNYPCYEDGANCLSAERYIDPAVRLPFHMKHLEEKLVD